MKKYIIGFVLGAVIFVGVGVYAGTLMSAKDISYNDTNVKDALDDLYTDKHFSEVAYLGKDTVVGNTTMTYTFNKDVNLGLVVISASNSTTDTSLYVSSIQSLTTGNFRLLDSTTSNYEISKEWAGHRSSVYVIEGVKKDSILTVSTRYAGAVQIFEIN